MKKLLLAIVIPVLLLILLGCVPKTVVGPQGERGLAGERGIQGIPGSIGVPGVQGPQGSRGLQGSQGERGMEGSPGAGIAGIEKDGNNMVIFLTDNTSYKVEFQEKMAAVSSAGSGGGFAPPYTSPPAQPVQSSLVLSTILPLMVSANLTTETEKVNWVRNWVAPILDVSEWDLLVPQPLWSSVDVAYSMFQNNKGGVWCGGAAVFLQRIYQEIGYDAAYLNIGVLGTPSTHAVVLVRADGKLLVQDAYFNATWVTLDGLPLDFFDLLTMLKDGRGDNVTEVRLPLIRETIYKDKITIDDWYDRPSFGPDALEYLVAQGLPPEGKYYFLYPTDILGLSDNAALWEQVRVIVGK